MKRHKTINFRIRNGEGSWVISQKDIAKTGVQFYQSLFSSEQHNYDFSLISKLIPQLISQEHNALQTKVPTMEEI